MSLVAPRRLALSGRGLAAVRTLPALLDDAELVRVQPFSAVPALDAVLAWGQRPSAGRAAAFAARHGLPVLRIEDGFLRSLALGADAPPLSVVLDDLGIYFDARAPSRLESLVSAGVDAAGASRAQSLRRAWCAARVSKYNHARDDALSAPLPPRFVLVVDQTAGDASIAGGLADAASFTRMLAAARDENPDCVLLLKVHPDVVAGRKRGHFDVRRLASDPRVRVVADAVHPVPLLEAAEKVYTVTSQLGFEALLHGRPVRVFGMPFYAGWGLTQDALPAPARRGPAMLDALVHAALVEYPRYIDPETGRRCSPERLLEWLALQRRQRARFPARLEACGFAPAKAASLQRFLAGSEIRRHWSRHPPAGAGAVVCWGRRAGDDVDRPGRYVAEDGFLRSVGLGADLVEPMSWVIDDTGIYYDATRPSRLETLLQQREFDAAARDRAARLREAILAAGVTKYNLAGRAWQRPRDAARVVLVAGQVETDASIAWGAPSIRRNIDLLKAVRAVEPGAWLVYKPHPDVVAGVRRAGVGEDAARAHCDEIVPDVSLQALFDAVDEVHVLTSLAGFEALLRGKPVTCWGQPFYAGWGLTTDQVPPLRRTRRRTLDELVAAALVEYPLYVSRMTGDYTTPERALQELVEWRNAAPPDRTLAMRARRLAMALRARLFDR